MSDLLECFFLIGIKLSLKIIISKSLLLLSVLGHLVRH